MIWSKLNAFINQKINVYFKAYNLYQDTFNIQPLLWIFQWIQEIYFGN